MCKQHFNGCGIQGLDTGQGFALDGNIRSLWGKTAQGGEELLGTAVASPRIRRGRDVCRARPDPPGLEHPV